jgi:hypothetical protein
MAIFPKPYSGGTKSYPIIGSSTTYTITESSIQDDLDADPARAFYLNEVAVIPDDPYKFIGVSNTITLLFQNCFGDLSEGYSYVLFPNSLPKYLSFISYANYGEAIPTYPQRYALQPTDPSNSELYWGIDSTFEFDGKSYALYKIRGYDGNTKTVMPFNLHITTLAATN